MFTDVSQAPVSQANREGLGPSFRQRNFVSLREWRSLSRHDQAKALADFSQHDLMLQRATHLSTGEPGYRLISTHPESDPLDLGIEGPSRDEPFRASREVHLMVGTEVGFIVLNALSETDARQKVRSFLKLLLLREVPGI